MAFASLDAFAISKENERMAKQLINEYYALLQEYVQPTVPLHFQEE